MSTIIDLLTITGLTLTAALLILAVIIGRTKSSADRL